MVKSFGEHQRALYIGIGKQEGKFIAAVPCCHVAGPSDTSAMVVWLSAVQQPTHRLEDLISRCMPVQVVDSLEMIEI